MNIGFHLCQILHMHMHTHTLAKTRCNQWGRCKDASTKCPRFIQIFCSARSFHWFLKCFLWYQIASKLSSFSRGAPEPLSSRKHVWYNHNHNGRAQNEREKDNSTKFLTLARRERSSGVATFFLARSLWNVMLRHLDGSRKKKSLGLQTKQHLC